MDQPEKQTPETIRRMAERVSSNTTRLSAVMLIVLAFAVTYIALPELYRPGFLFVETPIMPAVAAEFDLSDGIVNGIHVETGLIVDEHWELVRGTCTACHSAKLVTQNRADREGWTRMIRWMQKTQKLWDLGENEKLILDYLSTNYPPQNKGRRARLTNIEWYDLKP